MQYIFPYYVNISKHKEIVGCSIHTCDFKVNAIVFGLQSAVEFMKMEEIAVIWNSLSLIQ